MCVLMASFLFSLNFSACQGAQGYQGVLQTLSNGLVLSS